MVRTEVPLPCAPVVPRSKRDVGGVVAGAAPFAVAAVAYAVFIWRSSFVVRGHRAFSLFDDAMISMAYARNLAQGHGLVWYPGAPRVEGITNPLWTGVMALVHVAGFGDNTASLAVMLIGGACILGAAAIARALVRTLAPDARLAAALVPWLVAFNYALVFWTLRGMEVGFIALLLLGAIYACVCTIDGSRAAAWWAVALIAAGQLTRLDFTVFAVVLIAFVGLRIAPAARRRALAIIGGGAAVAVVGQELARRAYYGAWVPNTYTLKLGKIPIASRLHRGALALEWGLFAEFGAVVVLAAAGIALTRDARTRAALIAVGAAFVAAAAYSVWVGGDAWEWMGFANRYMTPAVAALMVPAAFGVQQVADRLDRRPVRVTLAIAGSALALILLATVIHPNPRELEFVNGATPGRAPLVPLVLLALLLTVRAAWRRPVSTAERWGAGVLMAAAVLFAIDLQPVRDWRDTDGGPSVRADATAVQYGAYLRTATTPGATLAVTWAGAPIYFSHRRGIDVLGKNDPRIANEEPRNSRFLQPGHDKYDLDVSVFEYRPDVVAQAWHPTRTFLRRALASGYVLVHPVADGDPDHVRDQRGQYILVKAGSPNVDWSKFVPADATELARHLAP